MSFFFSREHDLAVAKISKAGSTTIRAWLPAVTFRDVDNESARAASRRVAFIRHPIDRLESCYSYFCYLRAIGKPYTNRSLPIHVVDRITSGWNLFVDHVLSEEVDSHWQQQSDFITDVPNILHRFEDFPKYYRNYWNNTPQKLNSSKRIPVWNWRTEELLAHYADDVSLYNNIQ